MYFLSLCKKWKFNHFFGTCKTLTYLCLIWFMLFNTCKFWVVTKLVSELWFSWFWRQSCIHKHESIVVATMSTLLSTSWVIIYWHRLKITAGCHEEMVGQGEGSESQNSSPLCRDRSRSGGRPPFALSSPGKGHSYQSRSSVAMINHTKAETLNQPREERFLMFSCPAQLIIRD